MGGRRVLKGSWVMGVHIIDDALWHSVKDGTLTGFSVGGTAVRSNTPYGEAA